jgi:hypothetical protein
MRVFDEIAGQATDVDQARAVGTEFDKHSKVGNANHQSGEHGSLGQLIEARYFASQGYGITKFANVCERELQARSYRLEFRPSNLPASGQFLRIHD